MEEYNQIVALIALSMGAAWASGINIYATVLMLGVMGATGNISLPEELQMLSDPMVIGAAGLMYFIEFFTDKIPGVDTAWDALHTFVRVPAGAILAAGAVGDISSSAGIAAGLLGGGLALGTHSMKAGTRVMINTSPEPISNWTASITEDLAVIGGLWTALNHPTLFVVLLLIFIILMIWLLPKLWKGVKTVFKAIVRFLGINNSPDITADITTNSAARQPDIMDTTLKLNHKKEKINKF
jgi:hypothetical protein